VDHRVDALDLVPDRPGVADIPPHHLDAVSSRHALPEIERDDRTPRGGERALRRFTQETVRTREENSPYHCGLIVATT
jgi:hypothetical protein